jgi:hypothetical protein
MRYTLLTVGLLTLAAPASGEELKELRPPIHALAAGKPLDVEHQGHAAPFFGDFDGDGLPDLLVGQFQEGWLRVYRNAGSRGAPKFEAHTYFTAGGERGRVPVG